MKNLTRISTAAAASFAVACAGLLAAPSASATAACNSTLYRGSHGQCVTIAQDNLNRAGFDVGREGSDGSFGPATRAAVKAFQKAYGIPAVGWIGPQTRAKLNSHPVPPASKFAHLKGRDTSGTVFIVDKSDRKLYVFTNGRYQRMIVVRTGGQAWDQRINKWVQKDTPTGKFWVQAKIKNGYSKLYEADMPYFTVFNGNIGFHYSALFLRVGYGANGKLGSHGCVNIANKNDAKYVFDKARTGHTRVFVQS